MFIYLVKDINMIKGVYEKKTANITLNGKRPNVFFSLQSKIRQEYLFLPLLFTSSIQCYTGGSKSGN